MPSPQASGGLKEELAPSISGPTHVKKLYQVWPARNHPLCQGRLFLGVHWANLLFNILLTLALVVLFCVYTAYPIHWSLILVAVLLTALTETFLLLTSLTDPGIVPRSTPNPSEDRRRRAWEEERDRRITATTRRALGMPSHPLPADTPDPLAYLVPTQRVRAYEPGGGERVSEYVLKWCVTCNVYRPYGASHCRDCDVCVEGFDHHCPWISNCVGKRNHRWFVAFIFALTALTVFVFVVSLYSLIEAGVTDALSDSLGQHIVAIVEVVFCFVTGWCFVSLSSYHCYLIAEHTTTNQHIKQQRAQRQRYADQAFARHQQYHAQIRGEPVPAPLQPAAAPPVPPSTEEVAVAVLDGSAFTEGTEDDREEKEGVGIPAAAAMPLPPPGRAGVIGGPGVLRPELVQEAGYDEEATSVVNTFGAEKTYPYPDVDAHQFSEGPLHACHLFFCSPLPPRHVDMMSDVVVDEHGKILSYNASVQP